MTIPRVFIVESLAFDDEKHNRYEGKIISSILELNEKPSEYYYIRTKAELIEITDIFYESDYRYLHLSCHGDARSMATTLDRIAFAELGEILRPHLRDRRLFVSACEMVNDDLARAIIPSSGCYSIIGPSREVAFSDAAILWASFYHLMFNYNFQSMKREGLVKYCQRIAKLFEVPLNYYSASRNQESGFKLTPIKP